MSSIFGIYHFDRQRTVDREDLVAMAAVMRHRGTAQEYSLMGNIGIGISEFPSQKSRESSPESDRSGCFRVVLDGKIFPSPLQAGDSARGTSECFRPAQVEVDRIEQLYRTHGIPFLDGLDGSFSLALWDPHSRRLILARDRFGLKPLYFLEDSDRVIFASEAKAIFEILRDKPSINYNAIYEYFTFRFIAGGATLFSGIQELQPAHYLEWKESVRNVGRYWSGGSILPEKNGTPFRDPLDRLEELIRLSIRKRTRDVDRVGATLSGGIDSGLVISLASRESGRHLESMTIGFRETGWDERPFARLVGEKYRTRHHELEIRSDRFACLLSKLNWHNDNPLSDPNSVLVYILSEYAREHVDVLLNGEGADEVFLGYPRYNIMNAYRISRKWPSTARRALVKTLSLIRERKVEKLTRTFSREVVEALIFNSAFVSRESIEFVLREDLGNHRFPVRREMTEESRTEGLLSRLMNYEIGTYMVSSLNRLDRMGMAAGFETTPVFLDNALFDYSLGIPEHQKISLLKNKIILRKLASRHLPKECMKMPKSGFGVPISDWLRTDRHLTALLRDLPERRAVREVLRKDRVTTILDQHDSGIQDHSELIWGMLNYALWHEQYYGSR